VIKTGSAARSLLARRIKQDGMFAEPRFDFDRATACVATQWRRARSLLGTSVSAASSLPRGQLARVARNRWKSRRKEDPVRP